MPGSFEHEVRVACGSGHGQNLVFLDFQGFQVHNVDFLEFSRRSLYVLALAFARSRVSGVVRLFDEISVFSDSCIFFIFRVCFGSFKSVLAFYHATKTVFGHFIKFQHFQ